MGLNAGQTVSDLNQTIYEFDFSAMERAGVEPSSQHRGNIKDLDTEHSRN